MADLKLENTETAFSPACHPDRPIDSHRKASPPGSAPYETNSVAFEKSLEDLRITGKGDPGPKISPPTSKTVATRSKHPSRSATGPSKSGSSDLPQEGWGAY